ncbi:small nuclear ribonucleoprotein Sm D1 [[Candida] anglica]|uniref:Small nuclear ribonucleoprotein Sm D1 n=1 Tax=[Candida] anglica TaxID=148631 RepID=A0ABP0EHR0_9ASCO
MKLVRFLMNMPNATNQPITVELKNGNSVNGQLLSCSPSMNISLKNIKLVQPHQDPQILQFISIRGNQIRQIILPDDLNIDNLLANSVVKIKGSGAGPGNKDLAGGNDRKPTRGGFRGGRGGGASRGRGRAF